MTLHQMSLSNWWRLGQQRGLIALLNAVYNHFEIDGNYSHAYAPAFFNSTLPTPWGAAISFGRRDQRPVSCIAREVPDVGSGAECVSRGCIVRCSAQDGCSFLNRLLCFINHHHDDTE
jgi:hypothetical protein